MFNLRESEMCELCNVREDLEHMMMKCDRHQLVRNGYEIFENCTSMTNLLKETDFVRYRAIANFVREAKLDI